MHIHSVEFDLMEVVEKKMRDFGMSESEMTSVNKLDGMNPEYNEIPYIEN